MFAGACLGQPEPQAGGVLFPPGGDAAPLGRRPVSGRHLGDARRLCETVKGHLLPEKKQKVEDLLKLYPSKLKIKYTKYDWSSDAVPGKHAVFSNWTFGSFNR